MFAEADGLRAVLVERIIKSPSVNEPLQLVVRILTEFNWESMGSRDFQRKRQTVIAANPELLERDLTKLHMLAEGLSDALRRRGVDAEVATLAARVGAQVFLVAYERWLEAGHKPDLATTSRRTMSYLASIVPTTN